MSPTGHLAIGIAAKRYVPTVPLIVFLIAAYAIDLIYFGFLAGGVESTGYAPWSHSLLMAVVWSALALLITMGLTRKFVSGAVVGLVVFSHWVLDFIVWNDMLIAFDESIRVGFGVYNAIGFSQISFMEMGEGTIIASSIELGMLVIGVAYYLLYRRKTRQEKSGALGRQAM